MVKTMFKVLPDVYPGYQKVTNPQIREKFEKAWGVTLPSEIGVKLTEVPHAVLKENKIKAYYIFGEDPVQSDPDAAEVREALDACEFVVVQDIFMNKTALHADVILPATSWGEHDGVYTCADRGFQRIRKAVEPKGDVKTDWDIQDIFMNKTALHADVILPATSWGEHDGIYSCADRGFQRIRKAVEPKGDVKTDWDIICRVSTAMGYPMNYNNTKEIWDEMRSLTPSFFGATYEKIEKLGCVQWPCRSESDEDKGSMFLHKDGNFSTDNGRGKLFATEWRPPYEIEDDEYPFSLSTVREVGHYSVRTMTGNCRTLSQLEDEPGYLQINYKDAQKLCIKDNEIVRVSSRRGSVLTRALVTDRVQEGATYMTYQWWVL